MREFILINEGLRVASFDHLKDAMAFIESNEDIDEKKCCIQEHVLIEQCKTVYSGGFIK